MKFTATYLAHEPPFNFKGFYLRLAYLLESSTEIASDCMSASSTNVSWLLILVGGSCNTSLGTNQVRTGRLERSC